MTTVEGTLIELVGGPIAGFYLWPTDRFERLARDGTVSLMEIRKGGLASFLGRRWPAVSDDQHPELTLGYDYRRAIYAIEETLA